MSKAITLIAKNIIVFCRFDIVCSCGNILFMNGKFTRVVLMRKICGVEVKSQQMLKNQQFREGVSLSMATVAQQL